MVAKKQSALKEAASAAAGTALATLVLHPLEVVKVTLQSQVRAEGPLAVLRQLLQREGPLGLTRGVGPVLVRSVASDSTYFGVQVLVKRAYNPHGRELSHLHSLLCGLVSAWITRALTQPLETVSTRLLAGGAALGLREVVRELYSEYGLRGLWRGYTASLVLALNPALQYTVYDAAVKFTRRCLHGSRDEAKLEVCLPLPARVLLLLGFLTRALTLPVVYPLIRVKTCLQASSAGCSNELMAMLRISRHILQTEGRMGLFKGLQTQLGKSMLSNALLLTAKEKTNEFMSRIAA